MKLIVATRKRDGARIYINPESVYAVYPAYGEKDATVIDFPGGNGGYVTVSESTDTVAHMLDASVCSHNVGLVDRKILDSKEVKKALYAAVKNLSLSYLDIYGIRKDDIESIIDGVPSLQLDNQVHLCDSCRCVYPDCLSGKQDVIFGNAVGDDNICACSKYLPK